MREKKNEKRRKGTREGEKEREGRRVEKNAPYGFFSSSSFSLTCHPTSSSLQSFYSPSFTPLQLPLVLPF
jgi:hypothetical protein